MKFTNPPLPEGINAGRDSVLKDLFVYGGGILVGLGATIFLLYWLLQFIAPWVPFSWERGLAGGFTALVGDEETASDPRSLARLEDLAQRLAAVMALPEDMTLALHHIDGRGPDNPEGTVNAFATLGGHVVIFEGLLRRLPDENAVAMVLAHEMAHVRHRDPLRSASAGLLIVLLQSLVFGDSASVQSLGQASSLLAVLHHSRQMESAADAAALEALVLLYGHAGGATALFDSLAEAAQASPQPPPFLASHPDTAARITALAAMAARNGWPADGPRTAW